MRARNSFESSMARLAERLVAPSWFLILAVFALPILGALWLSFRNETLGSFMSPKFVGFENYSGAFADPRVAGDLDGLVDALDNL